MSDRLLVSAIGAVIDVDLSDRSEAFRAQARAAWTDALYVGERVPDARVSCRSGVDDTAALSLLSTDVTLAALAHRRGEELWMLHAAGLADEGGRVIVLSAPSGTGKTTAARHLSQRYAYVSDETVAVGADGAVVPYRKPLSIITDHASHKAQVALSSIDGGRPLPSGLHVAKIVVLDRRDDGPEAPRIEPLDLTTALELLAPQTSYLTDAPRPLHLIERLLAMTGGAVRLHYREVTSLDATIDALLRAEPVVMPLPTSPAQGEVASAAGAEARAEAASIDPAAPTEPRYSRTAVVDALDLPDGRLAIVQRSHDGSTVQVFDGIGPAVWHAADGADLDELTAAVVAVHGEPEGQRAIDLVRAAVDLFVSDGVLAAATPAGLPTTQA